MMDIDSFWKAVVAQDADEIRSYFRKTAVIRWHNTNEQFTLEEFIRVNCEYPGNWKGEIERIEKIDNLIITVTRVFSEDPPSSVHATSFIRMEEDKIISIDEYWGDDGIAPQWRRNMCIGTPIR